MELLVLALIASGIVNVKATKYTTRVKLVEEKDSNCLYHIDEQHKYCVDKCLRAGIDFVQYTGAIECSRAGCLCFFDVPNRLKENDQILLKYDNITYPCSYFRSPCQHLCDYYNMRGGCISSKTCTCKARKA